MASLDSFKARKTLTAGGNTLAGVVVTAAGNGITRVEVRLDGTAV